jgi:carboxypeptidase Q
MQRSGAQLAAFLLAIPALVAAQETVDLQMVTRIRDEGLNRSQVMETARVLTDEIGPRVTNSPGYRRATEWTRDRLAAMGLADAHLEPFEFGRGWSFSYVNVRMTKPDVVPLEALPKGWTPGTAGAVRGPAMHILIEKAEDLEQYKGKLAGKVVLVDAPPRPASLQPEEWPERYTEEDLDKLEQFPVSDRNFGELRRRFGRDRGLAHKRAEFFKSEGVLATFEVSAHDGLLLQVQGDNAYKIGEDAGVPGLVMAAEQFNRIERLLDKGTEIELEVNVEAAFQEDTPNVNNVVAEIPGADPRLKGEVVMAGAHLDSWHAGTGATDNAAGCAVVMEAARILEALGVKPRRTIRVALWAGEEQGLLGSRAYVSQHFAFRPEPDDPAQRELPEFARTERKPLQFKPEWKTLAAYFNFDNGSGKIRGIYAQENAAVRPIFAAWLEPFHDLGADTVTLRRTGGTDHQSFDGVGLPGFQFIQDGLDYDARTHHTAADTFDRLQAADLKQASVIMASFIYNAAMRNEMLPRKPIPPDMPPRAEGERGGPARPAGAPPATPPSPAPASPRP